MSSCELLVYYVLTASLPGGISYAPPRDSQDYSVCLSLSFFPRTELASIIDCANFLHRRGTETMAEPCFEESRSGNKPWLIG